MPIRTQCYNCQAALTAADHLRGKMIRCPYCQEPTKVPGPAGPRGTQMGPGRASTQITRAPYPQYEDPEPPPRRAPVRRPAPPPEEEYVDDEEVFDEPPPRAKRRAPEPEPELDHDDEPAPKPKRRGRDHYEDDDEDPIPLPSRRSRKSSGVVAIILVLFLVLGVVGGGVALYVFRPDLFQFQGGSAAPVYARYISGKANAVLAMNFSGPDSALLKKYVKLASEMDPDRDKDADAAVLEVLDTVYIGGDFSRDIPGQLSVIFQTSKALEIDVIRKAFHLGEKETLKDKTIYRKKETGLAKQQPKANPDKKDPNTPPSNKGGKGTKGNNGARGSPFRIKEFAFVDGKTIVTFTGTLEEFGELLENKTPLSADMLAQIKKVEKHALWGVVAVEDSLKAKVKKGLEMVKGMHSLAKLAAAKPDPQADEKTLEQQKTMLKLMGDGVDLLQVVRDAKYYTLLGNCESGALNLKLGVVCDVEASAKKGADIVDGFKKDLVGLALEQIGGKDSEQGKLVTEFANGFKVEAEGVDLTFSAAISKSATDEFEKNIAALKKAAKVKE